MTFEHILDEIKTEIARYECGEITELKLKSILQDLVDSL
jgi:hypothetical protein